MLPTTTRIPQVIDRLIALHQDATGYQVTDGAHVGELDHRAIAVGLSVGSRMGYTAKTSAQADLGRTRYREAWEVTCFLSIMSGGTDMKPLRDEAGEKLGALAVALSDLGVVASVWDRATLGDTAEWVPEQAETGAIMSVLYTVEGVSLL